MSALQRELRPPAVSRIAGALEKSAVDEPLQNPCDRARMETQNMRQIASGDSRELSDDAEYETLRSGDSQLRIHPLGQPLQSVFDRPEQAQEIKNRILLRDVH